MISFLIDRYKNYRKQGYLNTPNTYSAPLAFVGAGSHSIGNLYPVIYYLGLPLQSIVTKTLSNAEKMALRFPNCSPTNDLKTVLDNKEIKGVMVCTQPKRHFQLAKQILESGKNLFIEKPPCSTSTELTQLIELAKKNNLTVVVGTQKRYATVYQLLKNNISPNGNYHFSYATGSYAKEETLLDLFIHPLDLALFLFGPIKSFELNSSKGKAEMTLQLLVQHENGYSGTLLLSTAHQWSRPLERLEVFDENGYYLSEQMRTLSFSKKPTTLMGVPLEKVFKQNQSTEFLYHNSGFIPMPEFNALKEQGYADVIECFAKLVNGKKTENHSSLEHLLLTYKWIEAIHQLIH